MYRKILLSVDLHDEASWKTALPTAVEYCQAFGAELHLVTVVPDLPTGVVSVYVPGLSTEKMLDEAVQGLADFAGKNIPEEIPVQHSVDHGSVYKGILATAEESGADLIVMASHRPEMSDYLLGPNAARVVRHSECSVLVVRD